MYKLINVNADPYENDELFSYQLQIRKMQLKSIIKNKTAIKIDLGKGMHNIISPSFKEGYDKRVTWINNNIILGHKDFNNNNIQDVIQDFLYDGNIIEVI